MLVSYITYKGQKSDFYLGSILGRVRSGRDAWTKLDNLITMRREYD